MTRPIFLNLLQIKFPVTAIVSILHRVSGVVIFLAIPLVYIWLYMSICSESSYASLAVMSGQWFIKILYLLIIIAVLFHALAGIRHMYYDFSSDHGLAGAKKTAWSIIFLTVILSAMAAYRIFVQV